MLKGLTALNDDQSFTNKKAVNKAVFTNDLLGLSAILIDPGVKDIVGVKDVHGNSALHLATLLGRRGCVRRGCVRLRLLLADKAPIKFKNSENCWPIRTYVHPTTI